MSTMEWVVAVGVIPYCLFVVVPEVKSARSTLTTYELPTMRLESLRVNITEVKRDINPVVLGKFSATLEVPVIICALAKASASVYSFERSAE